MANENLNERISDISWRNSYFEATVTKRIGGEIILTGLVLWVAKSKPAYLTFWCLVAVATAADRGEPLTWQPLARANWEFVRFSIAVCRILRPGKPSTLHIWIFFAFLTLLLTCRDDYKPLCPYSVITPLQAHKVLIKRWCDHVFLDFLKLSSMK